MKHILIQSIYACLFISILYPNVTSLKETLKKTQTKVSSCQRPSQLPTEPTKADIDKVVADFSRTTGCLCKELPIDLTKDAYTILTQHEMLRKQIKENQKKTAGEIQIIINTQLGSLVTDKAFLSKTSLDDALATLDSALKTIFGPKTDSPEKNFLTKTLPTLQAAVQSMAAIAMNNIPKAQWACSGSRTKPDFADVACQKELAAITEKNIKSLTDFINTILESSTIKKAARYRDDPIINKALTFLETTKTHLDKNAGASAQTKFALLERIK